MVRETNLIANWREAILWSVALQHLVVILVVLTTRAFRFSLFISQLLAKAIPVRGAIFRKARSGRPERAFCFNAKCVDRQRYSLAIGAAFSSIFTLP
ncbi:hypothetical protein DMW52_11165 [Serratia marcescens]|nr:hypothetical protein DMW52_11165 [Serratia marcescens]PYA89588.1 hypothetical protein DMW54_05795 [Serratia marcescens]